MESADLIDFDSDDSFVVIGYGSPGSSVVDYSPLDVLSSESQSSGSGEMCAEKCPIVEEAGDARRVIPAIVIDFVANEGELEEETLDLVDDKRPIGKVLGEEDDSEIELWLKWPTRIANGGLSDLSYQVTKEAEDTGEIPTILVDLVPIEERHEDEQEPPKEAQKSVAEHVEPTCVSVSLQQPKKKRKRGKRKEKLVDAAEITDDEAISELQPAEIEPHLKETDTDELKLTDEVQSEVSKKKRTRRSRKDKTRGKKSNKATNAVDVSDKKDTCELVPTVIEPQIKEYVEPVLICLEEIPKSKKKKKRRGKGKGKATEKTAKIVVKLKKIAQNVQGTTLVEVHREMNGKSAAQTVQQTKVKPGNSTTTPGTAQQKSSGKKSSSPGKTRGNGMVDVVMENDRLKKALAAAEQKAVCAEREKHKLAEALGQTRKQLKVERSLRQAMEHSERKMTEIEENVSLTEGKV